MSLDETNTDFNHLLKHEQALMLVRNASVTLISSSAIAIIIAGLAWKSIPHFSISIWILTLLITNIFRYIFVSIFKRYNLLEYYPEYFLRTYQYAALLAGCIWASIFIIGRETDLSLNPAITLMMCGITAASAVQGTVHSATVLNFILPIALAYFVSLVGNGGLNGFAMATSLILYITMLTRSAINLEAAYTEASRVKHAATGLAASLRSANAVSAATATRLKTVVAQDSLTGLANRVAFNDFFSEALEKSRHDQSSLTLLLIDLDRFKMVNDTFGHTTGDHVLIEVACRLRREIGVDTFVARLGGDEFAVILASEHTEAQTLALGERIIAELSKPISFAERQVLVGASVGVSVYPRDGFNAEELQISADVALYAAKSSGRGSVRCFDDKLRAATDARRVYELDLGDSLADGSLEVWFQPQISLSNQRVIGLESLIRWNHPNHGWVPPPEIVAAAIATRQSEALTAFVVEGSCRMSRALTIAGNNDLTVSFNVSPQEFGQYSLADLIARALVVHNVSADRLEVEITEESVFADERGLIDLQAIAAMGVRIAIDDFGVAYSSFGALRNLDFDCIKIDRIFVEGITNGARDRALVQAILGVARALGVDAIAEGVETAEQVAVLTSLGCNRVQGYYFARPMPADTLLAWLEDHSRDAAQPTEEWRQDRLFHSVGSRAKSL